RTEGALAAQRAQFAAWGDVDNDGLVDVLLCDSRASPRLLSKVSATEWKVRDVAALKGVGGTRDCQLIDIDHDGDLDILIVTAKGERLLLANNGDGTFRSLADKLPRGVRSDAVQWLGTDLDDDRDLDLVVLHSSPPHEVLANERVWVWKPAPGFDA